MRLKDKNGLPLRPDYVCLVTSTQQALRPAPGSTKLILAFERPDRYGNKGSAVAYTDGQLEWVTPAKLGVALEATKAWLAKKE